MYKYIKNKKQIKAIASRFLKSKLLKNKVKNYSYGQKKILALALVDILKPRYLIMDEISNGLDFEMIRYSQKLIKSWSEDGTGMITGHQFSFYNEIIDVVFIFKNNDVALLTKDFQNKKLKLEDMYDEAII